MSKAAAANESYQRGTRANGKSNAVMQKAKVNT